MGRTLTISCFKMLTEDVHFRSIVSRLEVIDPQRLSHAEKLAFWINIHNALVMHVMILLD